MNVIQNLSLTEKAVRRVSNFRVWRERQKQISRFEIKFKHELKEWHGQFIEQYKSSGAERKLLRRQQIVQNEKGKSIYIECLGLIEKSQDITKLTNVELSFLVTKAVNDRYVAWVGDAIGPEPFDLTGMEDMLASEGINNYELGASKEALRYTGKGVEVTNAAVLKAVLNRAKMIAIDMSDVRWNGLKEKIARSYFIEGKHPTIASEGYTSVGQDIKSWFNGDLNRANTAARTEVSVMESDAQMEWRQRSGIEFHSWVIMDYDAREEHIDNDGVVVKIGDPFPSGQIRVGDGEAALVINCRCHNEGELVDPETLEPWTGV